MEQEHQKKILIIVYGIPASGKSTFCKNLKVNKNVKILSVDNIQAYLHQFNNVTNLIDKFKNQQYFQQIKTYQLNKCQFNTTKWKDSRYFVKDNIQIIHQHGILIIEDDLLLTSQRKPFRRYAQKFNIDYLQIYIDAKLQQAIQNNKKRNEKGQSFVDNNTIQHAYQKIQFDQRQYTIKIKYNQQVSIEQIIGKCRKVPKIENDQGQDKVHLKTENQMKEIQIRQYISQIMKNQELRIKYFQNLSKKQSASILSFLKKQVKSYQGVEKFKKLLEQRKN